MSKDKDALMIRRGRIANLKALLHVALAEGQKALRTDEVFVSIGDVWTDSDGDYVVVVKARPYSTPAVGDKRTEE